MFWNWLLKWLAATFIVSRIVNRAPLRVAANPRSIVMYTRQGCHLCEQAWQQLEQAQKLYGFQLDQVDIDGDPELARKYGECVPVVTIDGKVRFRGAINGVLLKRLLSRV